MSFIDEDPQGDHSRKSTPVEAKGGHGVSLLLN